MVVPNTRAIHEPLSLDFSETKRVNIRILEQIDRFCGDFKQLMLTRWVPSFFRRSVGPSRLHPVRPIEKRFFGKTRIVIEGSTKAPSVNTVELNPFNKLRTVSKKTGLPTSHILKALCTREGKSFYLKVKVECDCEK